MTKIDSLKKVPSEKGYYIAGFVDGEGSFWISTRPRDDFATGWKFSPIFFVGNQDIAVLEICKNFLGCGKIREGPTGFYRLEVESRANLQLFVIPFFKKFGFLSNKKKHEFSQFQKAVDLVEKGIQTRDDLEKILSIRRELGKYRQGRLTHQDETIRKTFNFKAKEM